LCDIFAFVVKKTIQQTFNRNKDMKAISIYGEYVQQMMDGEKTEEYRSWNTNHRGDLLICTTATSEYYGFTACVVDLYDTEQREETDDNGDTFTYYAWKLRNFRWCVPSKVIGKQGFYQVPNAQVMLLSHYPSREQDGVWNKGLETCQKPPKRRVP
jgi:hypothetical protein